MAENNNIVPIIVACTTYNQIQIFHEFRTLASRSDSALNEQGVLVGSSQMFGLWRFYLIPRMGGLEKMVVIEERSEIIEVDTDLFWRSLAEGSFDPTRLEREYPRLTFSHMIDDHPAIIKAKVLDAETATPDYQWQWLFEREFAFSDIEPKHFVFTETNIRQNIKRTIGIPEVGGFDHRTTSIQTLNDQAM